MVDKKLYEELVASNDAYHKAVNFILEDKELSVQLKTAFATEEDKVFLRMNQASAIIKEHYDPVVVSEEVKE